VARKLSSTAVQEELYPVTSGSLEAREDYAQHERVQRSFDGARVVDLESEQESPFLRAQKRVAVRRATLPKKTAIGLKWAALALVLLAMIASAGLTLYRYGKNSWRFRIDSSDQIETVGAQHITRAQIMEVMGGDIGRNIFFVPLAQRQQQLQQIPWVESASVMRFVPNRLRIEIQERTPVAFVRIGSHISLIDAGGNLMELTPGPKHKYSFPIITGTSAAEPLSTRALRMRDYNELIRELDSGGARYSQDISEVDLSDGDDVKVMTADSGGGVLVHLGSGNYLQRYKIYVTHVEAWRQQFQKLDSVDLRYDGQIIVNPDLQGITRQPALTATATKAALAAGVKTAAIVNYEKYVDRPEPAAPSGKVTAAKTKPVAKSKAKAVSQDAAKATGHRAAPKAKAKVIATKNPGQTHPSVAPAAASAASTKAAPSQTPTIAAKMTAKASKPPTASATATTARAEKKPSAAIPKEKPQD
jgi:cell division protein FtsQ